MATVKTVKKQDKKHFPIGKKEYLVYTDEQSWIDKIKAKTNPRTRSAFIRTFHDVECVKTFLQNTAVEGFAYIVHDKDTFDDGTPKETHIHLLVKFSADVSLTWIAKGFQGQTTLVQKPYSLPTAYRYLTHTGFDDKYQYPCENIVEFNSKILSLSNAEQKDDDNAQRLHDYETLSLRENALKYGQNYIINHRRIETFIADMKADDEERELMQYETAWGDFATFDVLGVDPTEYFIQHNKELLSYLTREINDMITPVCFSTLRSLLIEFMRKEKQSREAYLKHVYKYKGE